MARRQDRLDAQIALRIHAPGGKKIPKRTLDKLLEMMVQGKPLPKTVEIRGIFWRNVERPGRLSMWRYHEGADLRVAPSPRESSPRGSLRDAIATLFQDRMPVQNVSFTLT